MTTVSSASLVVLVCVFLAASIGKLRSPAVTERATVAFGAPRWMATLLVPAELFAVLALVTKPAVGAAFSALLLVVFIAALVRTVRSGRIVSCGCFGAASGAPVSTTTIARNAAMIAMCAIAAFAPPLFRLDAAAVVPTLLVGVGLVVAGLLGGALIDVRRVTGAAFPKAQLEGDR